MEQVYSS